MGGERWCGGVGMCEGEVGEGGDIVVRSSGGGMWGCGGEGGENVLRRYGGEVGF